MRLIRLFPFICSALLSSGIFLLSSSAYAQTQGQPRIGAILPLSGDSAYWGENSRKGIELALRDMRTADAPRPLSVHYEDDECSPSKAVTAFQKLVSMHQVKVILGPVCSSSTAAVAPLAARAKVLLLAFSESDEIKPGEYLLRLWVPNGAQAKQLARYAFATKNIRSIAMLSAQNSFGTSLREAFRKEFTRLGGKIVAEEEYAPGTKTFKSELGKLRNSRPQAIFFASYITDGAIIVREAYQLGVRVPLLGPNTINNSDFFKATMETAEGLTFVDLPDSTTQTFQDRWKEEYKEPFPGIQSGAPIFYDITSILGAAVENKTEINSEYFRSLNFNGASGTIRFTSAGNLDRSHSVFQVRGGKPEKVDLQTRE